MTNLPYLAKLTMECVMYFHAYFTMWDVNLVPAAVNFTDMKVMKSMGQVDNIVCSKSAFFNSGNTFTAMCKIGNTVFSNNKVNCNEKNVKGSKKNMLDPRQYEMVQS